MKSKQPSTNNLKRNTRSALRQKRLLFNQRIKKRSREPKRRLSQRWWHAARKRRRTTFLSSAGFCVRRLQSDRMVTKLHQRIELLKVPCCWSTEGKWQQSQPWSISLLGRRRKSPPSTQLFRNTHVSFCNLYSSSLFEANSLPQTNKCAISLSNINPTQQKATPLKKPGQRM